MEIAERHSNDNDRRDVLDSWRGSWKVLAFGLFVLAYLVAIERPEWFVLRPASGTAAAMAKAATPPVTTPAKP